MRRNGNRTITVNKEQLINKIKENKAAHIEAYKKAVVAYKAEALKQINEQLESVNSGSLNAKLELVTPVNNEANYDKIIEMFNWEVNAEIELSQQEFNEYVQDETEFARHAMMSNAMYLG